MSKIQFHPLPNSMTGIVSESAVFPGEKFSLTLPEAIGDAAGACWQNGASFVWKESGNGDWRCEGKRDGELRYALDLTTTEEVVDVRLSLTNDSPRPWEDTLSFNCFNCAGSAALNDHECRRHWAGQSGKLRRLPELPRKIGPRPTVQLYSVEGATPGKRVPFVAGFEATPDVTLENWLAIRSRDGKRLAAVASEPCLFLFQNMEYSCIHSASSFGALAPGATGAAHLRIYLVESDLPAWRDRMRADFVRARKI